MTDKKYDEKLELDMSFEEALVRFSKATKEEIEAKGQEVTDMIPEGELELVPFRGAKIRKAFHNGEWWFSIVDVMAAITDTSRPRKYWSELKSKISKESGENELSDLIGQLPMEASDGKNRMTDVANTETLLRVIQSVPSPKAEPFKKWLARVGYERIQETQNPEIAIKRAIFTYQIQGRTDDWIEKRIRSIVVRRELTNEWQKRGIVEGFEYASLTNIISGATFGGVTPKGHKDVKGLKKHHNLRDHMTDLELIFTMLGEKSTAEITRAKDAKGFRQNAKAAQSGGKVAGNARHELEKEINQSVVSSKNFLGGKFRQDDPELLSAPKKKT